MGKLRERGVRTEHVTFALNHDDTRELYRLQGAADRATITAEAVGADAAAKRAATKAAKAVDEYLASIPTVTFHLRSIGAQGVEDLMAEHPPSDEQMDKAQAAAKAAGQPFVPPDYDVKTFPPALVAASTTKVVYTGDDPETIDGATLTADDIAEQIAQPGWSETDTTILFGLCRSLTEATAIVARDLVERMGKG